ncbi:MAG: aspartyl/glutamyl-tRNA amidotransferase subunit A [Acidobacteria bacterium]|nr:aspartyl/glutamyl-tRNA amidotransferase subunit A [Acidobacteriota bacterium]
MEDVRTLTIDRVHQGLRARQFSAGELAREALRIAEKENGKFSSYLHFCPERALEAASRVDAQIAKSEKLGELAGVPVAVKDVISTRSVRTTCGSRLLENYIPPYDATAVIRLESEGAVILGKTNCDEFAMGSSTENSAFCPVRNPVAPDRVPGGSSGGSAAAVAAGQAVVALGSDTGGSIRQPASFCGVVGVLPTYGRVSRYGLVAFASSLDHIGPLARTVKDAATVVGDRIRRGPDVFRRLGCEIREVSLPHTDYAIACYYIIATAEASSNLARYDGVRYTFRTRRDPTLLDMYRNTRGEGFGAEVKRRIILGTYVLSAGYYDAYYLKAQKVRALVARDFTEAFRSVDAILTPVSPFPAFKLGEKMSDPLEMYLSDIYTITGSLAGICGISVPCGRTSAGLPIGMQILAKHFDEHRMLRLAHAFETAGGFEV